MTPAAETCDVCIVGSGAGGGIAAYVLTKAGVNVVLLEAGDPWDDRTDSAMQHPAFQSPLRGAPGPHRPYGEFDAFIGGRQIDGEPYTTSGATPFDWIRARMVGGRTNVWGRISLRFGPRDFRGRSHDGQGEDWPIGYADLAPYYDALDRLIGISGSAEGLPNDPDGIFLPPAEPRPAERLVQQACSRLGIRCIPARLSVLTRAHGGRPACISCGHCNRGCRLGACFSSPSVLLAPALATGRLRLVTGAMARSVDVDSSGRATGVTYVEKASGADRRVRAGAVVLAAGACESARLLLNSACPSFPDGLGNAGGHVGRWLTDTTNTDIEAFVPQLRTGPKASKGAVSGHVYLPWTDDNTTLSFPRGYHIEVRAGGGAPIASDVHQIERFPGGGGYGTALKQAYRDHFGSVVKLSGRGEMIPNAQSACERDPSVVDQWGIPVLQFRWAWGEEERQQVAHMRTRLREIVDAFGGTVLSGGAPVDASGMPRPGNMSHEVGCVRMGEAPDRSAVDSQCAVHGIPNLVVADGGPFVSHPDKNPTWTIMALAWRSTSLLLDRMRRYDR